MILNGIYLKELKSANHRYLHIHAYFCSIHNVQDNGTSLDTHQEMWIKKMVHIHHWVFTHPCRIQRRHLHENEWNLGSSSKTKLARLRKANLVFSHMYNLNLKHTHREKERERGRERRQKGTILASGRWLVGSEYKQNTMTCMKTLKPTVYTKKFTKYWNNKLFYVKWKKRQGLYISSYGESKYIYIWMMWNKGGNLRGAETIKGEPSMGRVQ